MNRNRVSLIAAVVIVLMAGLESCSVLSQTQLDRIENLALNADSVVSAPSVIFSTLGEVRLERGLFYAASFSSPEARFEEIQALAESSIEEKKRAEKADVYVGILNSYFRALRSIANEERWRGVGREFRSLGRGVDSLIVESNELFGKDTPVGIAKAAGKTFGYFAENINKFRQTKYVKEFVALGDSLVAECSDSLTSILKSKSLTELIENESAGLEANYKAYTYAMIEGGYPPQVSNDKEYVLLVEKMSSVKQIRNKAVAALRSVKNGHHKLLLELGKEDQEKEVFEDFQSINSLLLELSKL